MKKNLAHSKVWVGNAPVTQGVSGVLKVLQGCTMGFQGCYKGVSSVLLGLYRCFTGVVQMGVKYYLSGCLILLTKIHRYCSHLVLPNFFKNKQCIFNKFSVHITVQCCKCLLSNF